MRKKINLEKLIQEQIVERLNNNTRDVLFNLGYMTTESDPEYDQPIQFVQSETNKYKLDPVKVTPVVIEGFDGNILPIYDIVNVYYDIPLTFQVDITSPVRKENILNAINEFKDQFIGQVIPLQYTHNEEVKYLNSVWHTTNMTPLGDVDIYTGVRYIFISLTLSVDISDGLRYGNQVEYYMKEDGLEGQEDVYEQIYPLRPVSSKEIDIEPVAYLNMTGSTARPETFNFGKVSAWSLGVQLPFREQPILWTLVEAIEKPSYRVNKKFKLKTIYYHNVLNEVTGLVVKTEKFSVERLVILGSGSIENPLGELSLIEFNLLYTKSIT